MSPVAGGLFRREHAIEHFSRMPPGDLATADLMAKARQSRDVDAALIHELSEALTALGNYLEAARVLHDGSAPVNSTGQYERASRIVQRTATTARTIRNGELLKCQIPASCDG